jgi:hypothetical protein
MSSKRIAPSEFFPIIPLPGAPIPPKKVYPRLLLRTLVITSLAHMNIQAMQLALQGVPPELREKTISVALSFVPYLVLFELAVSYYLAIQMRTDYLF